MVRSFENKLSLISRTSLAVLLMSVFVVALSCTEPTDDGNGNDNQNVNDNTNDNDNGTGDNDNGATGGPNPGQVFVEFDFSTQSNDVARALDGEGTEYGFFGVKDAGATSFDLTQIDIILPTQVAVRSSLDDLGRPSQILAEDDSGRLCWRWPE